MAEAVSGQALARSDPAVDSLAAAAAGERRRPPRPAEGAHILDAAVSDGEALRLLLRAARAVRARECPRPGIVTFSKKAFFSVTTLCRDVCTYCTYRSEPADPAAVVMMPRRDVEALGRAAARLRCVEALLVAGERPEERYGAAREWLAREGYSGTAEYLAHCSEALLGMGLFPHTNAGNLTRSEMAALSATNASIGLMLETSSGRLGGPGMPHAGAPSKEPAARLGALGDAGSLGIPTTTGVLVGIGETHSELAESLGAVAALHERHGHVQEVIVQAFRPKEGTAMRGSPPAGEAYLAAAAALARLMMPRANIQAPPNLSPGSYQGMLGAGINDWGGISPLTPDHVNPEFAWPAIRQVGERTARAGMRLACRFPVYPEFAGMADGGIRDRMAEIAEEGGSWLVREEHWRGP